MSGAAYLTPLIPITEATESSSQGRAPVQAGAQGGLVFGGSRVGDAYDTFMILVKAEGLGSPRAISQRLGAPPAFAGMMAVVRFFTQLYQCL